MFNTVLETIKRLEAREDLSKRLRSWVVRSG